MDRKKILFIINPISGVSKKKKLETAIARKIDNKQYDWSIAYTQYAKHAIEIAKNAAGKNFDIVAVAGGDGTVNEAAQALKNSETSLAIIPVGSGNGLARYLNIPLNIEKSIAIINTGKIQYIDTVSANNKIFVSIAGVGFDALVADKIKNVKIRGLFGYGRIIMKEFINFKPKKYTIQLDNNNEFNTEAMMINIANSNQFGYGVPLAPNASIDDGILDIFITRKPPIFKTLIVGIKYFIRHNSKYVHSYKAKSLLIKHEHPLIMNIDGEAIWMTKEISITVHPKSLKVITPKFK